MAHGLVGKNASRAAEPAGERVRCALCGADEPRPGLQVNELSLRSRTWVRWSVVKCRPCGLVYVSPRAVAAPDADYAGGSYGFSRSHLADMGVDGRPHPERVLDELGKSSGSRLLDIGCGTGTFLLAARRRGWEVSGVELSPYAAAVARRRGLEVRVGALSEARYPERSFDVVTLLDLIEHLEDPRAELREVHRVLVPGGRVVVETPNWRSIYRCLLRARWAALQPRVHILYFEGPTLRRLLESGGFEILGHRTEIVSLFSPEAVRRGFGPQWLAAVLRDRVVAWRLGRPPGRLDRFLLRIGPAARAGGGTGSYRMMAIEKTGALSAQEPTPERLGRLIRLLNWPTDRLFLGLGMGEQIRMVARAR